MGYFLAFDVGTTAMKCILYDTEFNEIFVNNEEYLLLTPSADTVELDCDTYFKVLKKSLKMIWESGINPDDVLSLTFTTQGETFTAVDKNGVPLINAIVWLDSRAEAEAEFIKNIFSEERLYSVTGLSGADGALPLAKLMWIKRNKPEVYDRTYKFLLLEDYLIFKLTGRTVSEKSLLSSTGWFDIVNEKYWVELLERCGIAEEKLPEISDCGAIAGRAVTKAAAECGLSEKTAIVTGAMDQVASALGAGNITEGIVTETTGTALAVGATVEKPDFRAETRVTVYKHFDDKFLYMPYCSTAGIVLKWFKNTMNINSYRELDELSEAVPAGSGGVMCLPYFSGKDGAENVNGAFLGLTLNTGRAELARSVLEGIAFMLNEQLELLKKTGIDIRLIKSMGGGSYSDIWTEIKASVCGVDIERSGSAQSTALGAAILGAVAVGCYTSAEEALRAVRAERKITKPRQTDAYGEIYKKYKNTINCLLRR